jgi:sulfate permease, SulP family
MSSHAASSTPRSPSPAPDDHKKPSWVQRHVPVATWLPEYKPAWLTGDVLAGLTVWALMVPEVMGYAGIAGVPVQYGLYAAPLAILGFFVFGGSKTLFYGPDASIATISAATVGGAVAASAGDKYIALTAILAAMVGVIYILLGVLKMGWIAKFFAQPVLAGFIVGLGFFIAIGELGKLVGLKKGSTTGDTVKIFVETIGKIGSWHGTTVAVGLIALALLFLMGRFAPKLPAALIVVVASILAVKIFSLDQHGVKLVGPVPTGFHFSPWSGITGHDLEKIIPGALAIVIVGFAQSVALAKAFGAKDHEKVDPNQELIGYGVANIGAGVLQGFAVTGSASKTAAAKAAGSRTPVAYLASGVLVVLTILFLAGLFKELPETVLAAIIIKAVWGLMDPAKLVRLRRDHLGEFWLALGAALGVVVINIMPGILIGVLLSFVLMIRRLDHPRAVLMGRAPDQQYFVALEGEADGKVEPVPDVLVYAFEAPLIFSNNEHFTEDLLTHVEGSGPRPHTVVLDCDGISEIDTTGADALKELHQTLGEMDIQLLLARVNDGVHEFLDVDGVLAELGSGSLFPEVRHAVDAAKAQPKHVPKGDPTPAG